MNKKHLLIIPLIGIMVGISYLSYPFINHAQAAGFTVNSLGDGGDSNLADSICDDGSGSCTLRAAIEQAQNDPGSDTITITATGVANYATALPTISEPGLTIIGPGSSNFEITTSGTMFLVNATDHVSISGIKITGVPYNGIQINDSNNNTFDDIIIVGDGISGIGTLMEFTGSSYNTVTNSHFSEGQLGFRFWFGSDHNTISDSSSMNNRHSGITIYDADDNTVSHCHIENSGDFGMFVIFGAERNLIEDSTIIKNNLAGITLGLLGGDGHEVNSNTFRNNIISQNTGGGISMSDISSSNTFINNIIADNNIGIVVGSASHSHTFLGNIFNNNTNNGLFLQGTHNITIGGINPGEGNVFDGNGQNGLDVENSNTITIEKNVFTSNSQFGLQISSGADNVVFKGNFVGIDSDGVTIKPNLLKGVDINNSTHITIGGDHVSEGNIISGNTNGDGLSVSNNSSDIEILGNYVGLLPDGATTAPNNTGIRIENSNIVSIGSLIGGEKNIISTNQDFGIIVNASENISVLGNYIGFGSNGLDTLPNTRGVSIENSAHVTIGGSTATARNYIFSSDHSIDFVTPIVTDVSFLGNYIGVDIHNNPVLGSSGGITLKDNSSSYDMSGLTIGGSLAGQGNIIAASGGGFGIGININNVFGANILGNKIGTNVSGNVSPGFGNDIGVLLLSGSHNNLVGGILPGQGNIIAGNAFGGVWVLELDGEIPQNNSILGNTIFSNANNGIDLFSTADGGVTFIGQGPTPNDAGDGDTGPHNLLNHPVINTVDTGTGLVTYTLDVPAGSYRVEFFKNPTSGTFGEGEIYLGYDTLNSSGSSKIQTKTLSLSPGDYITATTTKCVDAGCTSFEATSEFSQVYDPAGAPIITPPTPSGGGSSSSGIIATCRDPKASNYQTVGTHNPLLCTYSSSTPVTQPKTTTLLNTGTPTTLDQKACPYFTQYLKSGARNSKVEVTRWQNFLNEILGLKLKVTGTYDKATVNAVNQFQVLFASDILTPWGLKKPTGYTYKTTRMKANQMVNCLESSVTLEGSGNGKTWVLPALK